MVRPNVIRNSLLAGAVLFSANACASGESARHKELRTAVSQDGFTAESGLSADGHTVYISALALGKCTFHNVVAKLKDTKDVIDISNYDAPVGQIGDGKFQTTSVDLKFQNAAQLQEELPALNCLPK